MATIGIRRGTDLAARELPARRSLRRFVRPYRWVLLSATVLTGFAVVVELAAPWPLKVVIDNAIGGKPLPSWLSIFDGLSPSALTAVAALVGVALVAASGFVGYAITYRMGATTEQIGSDIRSEAFSRLQTLSLRFHDRNRTGDLVARLTSDVSRVQDTLVAWFQTVIPETLTLVGMFAVMFAMDATLAIAALAVVPGLVLFVVLSRPRIKSVQRRARDRSGSLASRATETLRHVRAVQAFSREEEESNRFQAESDGTARSAIDAMAVTARLSPIANVILAVGAGFTLWLGVAGVRSGRITLGALLVILTYLSSVYGPIRSLSRLASTLAKGAASRDRLTEIFAAPEIVHEDPHTVEIPAGAVSVAFSHVDFAYRAGEPVLADVCIEVAPRETLCIVGQTGAGKSSLLSLILRLYDPTEGRIKIGGVDIRTASLRSLRERIALVPQDPWILDGSIRDNIQFGRTDANEDDVREVAAVALVDEFADRLPEGLDTRVGEGGAFLSGGQARRIALARALLRDASILLLDEPTSGLDAASEATVIEALRRVSVGRTVIVVSHRLRISQEADRILVLEAGRVTEAGSRDELLAAEGTFARYVTLQEFPTPRIWGDETLVLHAQGRNPPRR
jgi:ATP-binding cassette, subfamily B, bacterial